MSESGARCHARSRELHESLYGTASTVRGWVLLEEPGPWGAEALRDSRLDAEVTAGLKRVCDRLRLRVVLIRRVDRRGGDPPRRRCFLARTEETRRRIEHTELDDPAQVLDLDLEALAVGEPTGLPPLTEPLYLVCTQGRHDPCCAERGRPVAEALTEYLPRQTWEVSHIGGDRFAANLVVLPHGIYFGRVPPEEAVTVAESYARGEIEPEYLRGRCTYNFATQAAECLLRQRTGIRGVDELPLMHTRREGDETEVVFADPNGGRYVLRVRSIPADPARKLTCHAGGTAQPPEHRLLECRHEPV